MLSAAAPSGREGADLIDFFLYLTSDKSHMSTPFMHLNTKKTKQDLLNIVLLS